MQRLPKSFRRLFQLFVLYSGRYLAGLQTSPKTIQKAVILENDYEYD